MAVRSKLRRKEIAGYGPFQSSDSELSLIDQNSEKVHKLKTSDEKKTIVAAICIGKELWCLP